MPIIWLISYFNDKFGQSLAGQKKIWASLEKFNQLVRENPMPVVWLHAASAGEYEQLRPVLTRLRHEDVHVFQTLTSSTIYFKVSQSDDFDGVSYLPWDLYTRVNRFIRTLRPAVFINTRHDLWPNLLLAVKKNRIRSVLINANLYSNSLRLKPLIKQMNQVVFRQIDHMYTGSEGLKEVLDQLYSGPIEVTGDTRFDQVVERAQVNDRVFLDKITISDRRVIIYGSVDAGDLSLICDAVRDTLASRPSLHIIVPHEIGEKNLIPWDVELYRRKIRSIRRSEFDQYDGEPVIIWNTVGELADLYQHADLAYIGAGFTTGIHSVTEAAVYHVPSAHGWNYDLLAEAIELVDLGLSTVVDDENDLVDFLNLDADQIAKLNTKISMFISERVGATDKILEAELKLLTSSL